ncbi:SUMF1/EgtB/PvdO family nonheme iron enzyme [candidate division KSB1 bacterium]|nr:SUMF1/EgtB/PvdO family nonheme iron enzyme [candidate division KSB1 bacterium]
MKTFLILLIGILILTSGCVNEPVDSLNSIPYIDTGVDPDSWITIPAGEFMAGLHDHEIDIPYDYEIMATLVTNAQYVEYLNSALVDATIKIVADSVMGFYPGDPFQGHHHEFEIGSGDKVHLLLNEPGLRTKFDADTFRVVSGFENHPVVMVTWFGAKAYADYNGLRLPTELEWEKAARGSEDNRAYPWGNEISRNHTNYYSSHDLFHKVLNPGARTTPVGFYNGQTISGYETKDNRSPHGLFDMAGNVWQWCGDDYSDQHYRYARGGSFANYEYNLRVWARNSAGPDFYAINIGFRCARGENSEMLKGHH